MGQGVTLTPLAGDSSQKYGWINVFRTRGNNNLYVTVEFDGQQDGQYFAEFPNPGVARLCVCLPGCSLCLLGALSWGGDGITGEFGGGKAAGNHFTRGMGSAASFTAVTPPPAATGQKEGTMKTRTESSSILVFL